MGNIVVWYTGTICLLLYSSLLVFYLLRRRRLIFFYDRTLFVHHYLPAYIFKIMLSAFFLSHCASLLSRVMAARPLRLLCTGLTLAWLVAVVHVFQKFSVLSYAHTALSAND